MTTDNPEYRIRKGTYEGNTRYKSDGTINRRNCSKCNAWRYTTGGRPYGKLRLWYCADCIRAAEERKATNALKGAQQP